MKRPLGGVYEPPVSPGSKRVTLGWIDDRETDQMGYNAQGIRKGRYDKQHDRTYDERGLTVGFGNLLSALIFPKK